MPTTKKKSKQVATPKPPTKPDPGPRNREYVVSFRAITMANVRR